MNQCPNCPNRDLELTTSRPHHFTCRDCGCSFLVTVQPKIPWAPVPRKTQDDAFRREKRAKPAKR